jgi:hypothetical protein
MATLVNEGLEVRAKLTNGVYSGASYYFTDYVLGSVAGTEAITRVLSDMTVITTNGGARAAATTSYVADYKAQWVHTFTFTGDLTIYNIGIVNATDEMLMWHEFATPVVVHNGETAQITVTETEGRA